MCGNLRLLNIACAAKAKARLVTLTKPSREAPLAFSLLGGSEKGFRVFIDSVEPGSKAAEAGLKRGDQVRPMLPPSPIIMTVIIILIMTIIIIFIIIILLMTIIIIIILIMTVIIIIMTIMLLMTIDRKSTRLNSSHL